MGLQPLENKALSWGIIGKSAPILAEITIRKSQNCMFELTEIAARKDIHARVFPVVLEGTNIYEALGRLRYIKYWETKKAELDSD